MRRHLPEYSTAVVLHIFKQKIRLKSVKEAEILIRALNCLYVYSTDVAKDSGVLWTRYRTLGEFLD
jgi:hypothetical protein